MTNPHVASPLSRSSLFSFVMFFLRTVDNSSPMLLTNEHHSCKLQASERPYTAPDIPSPFLLFCCTTEVTSHLLSAFVPICSPRPRPLHSLQASGPPLILVSSHARGQRPLIPFWTITSSPFCLQFLFFFSCYNSLVFSQEAWHPARSHVSIKTWHPASQRATSSP